MARLFAEALL